MLSYTVIPLTTGRVVYQLNEVTNLLKTGNGFLIVPMHYPLPRLFMMPFDVRRSQKDVEYTLRLVGGFKDVFSSFQSDFPHSSHCWSMGTDISGWWFGTFFIFPYIGLLIIPIDFHIFQRGGPTTNQIWSHLQAPATPKSTPCNTPWSTQIGGRWLQLFWGWGGSYPTSRRHLRDAGTIRHVESAHIKEVTHEDVTDEKSKKACIVYLQRGQPDAWLNDDLKPDITWFRRMALADFEFMRHFFSVKRSLFMT